MITIYEMIVNYALVWNIT